MLVELTKKQLKQIVSLEKDTKKAIELLNSIDSHYISSEIKFILEEYDFNISKSAVKWLLKQEQTIIDYVYYMFVLCNDEYYYDFYKIIENHDAFSERASKVNDTFDKKYSHLLDEEY